MCGLIGYSGVNPFDPEKIAIIMIWNSLKRGEDSTGVYSPLNGHKKSLLKGSHYVLQQDEKYKLIPDRKLIAHVRKATVGTVTEKNAHPFRRGNCILAHNGSLYNHFPLLRKYGLNWASYEVDSDIICGIIGKTKTFDVLKEIDGPAALLMSDVEDPETLYVFRHDDGVNNPRELWKGYIGADMYISSMPEPLVFIGCNNVKEFKDNQLLTIKNGSVVANRNIKNKPYRESNTSSGFKNPSCTTSPYSHAMSGYLRCTVSASWTAPGKGKKEFETEKNRWYKIEDVFKDTIKFRHPDGNCYVLDDKYFNVSDIALKDDYIVAIKDTYTKNGSKLLLNKGEVGTVNTSYADSDIAIKTSVSNHDIIHNDCVRKMTAEEVVAYEKAVKENQEELSLYAGTQFANWVNDEINLFKLPNFNNTDLEEVVRPSVEIVTGDEGTELDETSDFEEEVETLDPDAVKHITEANKPIVQTLVSVEEPKLLEHFMTLNSELEKLKDSKNVRVDIDKIIEDLQKDCEGILNVKQHNLSTCQTKNC